MSGTSYIIAFIDLLFNLLLGITMMFIFAFLMMNPPGDLGKIDPPLELMLEISWDPESQTDIDLWAGGYDGTWVGFRRKDGVYFTLERDDLGGKTDAIRVNGELVVLKKNYEVIRFNELPAGEYFVNLHYYTRNGQPEEVKLTVTDINPFNVLYEGTTTLTPTQELTAVSFVVDAAGYVTDVRTDIQMPYVSVTVFETPTTTNRPPSASPNIDGTLPW